MEKILKNKKTAKKNQGFSLIEVLLSVFLVSIGLIAAVGLIGKSMGDSLDSRNQLIAGELAQEGAELVRNIRDNNWAINSDPTGHSFDNIPTGIGCRIDEASAVINCTAGFANKQLYINASGFYVHSSTGATATRFYRRVNISGATDRTITSMVLWNGAAGSFPTEANCNTVNHCAYAKVILTNWGE